MKDLFGRELSLREAMRLAHRAPPKKTGHAFTPGTGPAGETCGTCRHLTRVSMGNTYLKCEKMRAHWTHGPGTDVRAKDAACSAFEPRPPAPVTPIASGRKPE